MTSFSSTILDVGSQLGHVNVLLPLPLAQAYTYAFSDSISADYPLKYGDFVLVPLGSREVVGVVWEGEINNIDPDKIKDVLLKLDTPSMPESTRRFAEWVAKYNMASIGSVLKLLMNVPDALKPPKHLTAYSLATALPDIKMTSARLRIVDVLKDHQCLSAGELAEKADVGKSVINGLVKLGGLQIRSLPLPPAFQVPNWRARGPELSDEQTVVAEKLIADVKGSQFNVNVLEGVPGSGKTEVYLAAVSEALAQEKQALILLPEIALGAQWLERFKKRFGCPPAEWHSDLTPAKRRTTWRAVASAEAKVIVGARSALFLPYKSLGVIIVDEEHDQSFKQEDGVIYNARDMAIVRANLCKIPVTLVSATPSLESLQNVKQGRYEHFNLPDRYGGALLPETTIVDLRRDEPKPGKWVSPKLIEALQQTFQAGEQALLFLNRRGYAPLTLCQGCGYRFKCPQCTAWLVEHRFIGQLQCHHCGHHVKQPEKCPGCEQEDKLFACGPGVERLAEECSELFPEVCTEIAVSDNLQTPGRAGELVQRIEARKIDLIIGTQIIAKGYHFPYLTFVGVVDADVGLSGGDIRALERTYQLLYQVSGRAGRADRPGRVFIQTYNPENTVMQALRNGDHKHFIETLIGDRKLNKMPPFGRLVGVILSGVDEQLVDKAAYELARTAPREKDINTLGPAPAPLALLRGRHRRRFLVKAAKEVNIQSHMHNWVRSTKLPRKVRIQFDIDPYSFV